MTSSTGRRGRLLLVALVSLVAASVYLTILSAPATARTAQLTIRLGGQLRRVPSSYLGLSVEDNELPLYERQLTSFAALLGALRPPGDQAPVVLRVGGESADSSFWQPDYQTAVAPAYQQGHPILLTPQWMTDLGHLVRAAGLKVILDLNLAAHSPQMASDVVAAAEAALPRGSIGPFEIGNEPDLYSRSLIGLERANASPRFDWARRFTIADYISLFGDYTQAIASRFPGARFAGPSGMSRSPLWVRTLVASSQARHLSLVTAHNYPPIHGCSVPGAPNYPRPAKYLRDSVSAGVAHSEHFVVDAARQGSQRVRLTELGSAVGGCVAGGTDTFATALWAPDLLFNMLLAGVDGINMHLRGNGYLNTALNITPAGIYAEPLFYGMALFARTLGPRAQLRGVLPSRDPGRLKAWAVRLGDGSLHLLYLNKSARDTRVKLVARSGGTAVFERLRAPSISSNRTVTLAGQRLGADGLWHGPLVTHRVAARGGSYQVLVPAFSAVLLMVARR